MVGAVECDEPNPEFFGLRRDVGESETLARRGFEDHKHSLTSCLVGVSKDRKSCQIQIVVASFMRFQKLSEIGLEMTSVMLWETIWLHSACSMRTLPRLNSKVK